MLTLIKSSYFKDLLESFSYGVVIFNSRGEAYAVNAIATELLERSAEECVGRTPDQLFQRLQDSSTIRAMLLACRDNTACPKAVDTVLINSRGDKYHLSVATSLLIENQKIFGILVSMHDNTHIYELHEREKYIIEQNHRLQKERAESVLHLSRAMAHQIRNPVMSIGGFAKLLRRRLDDDELGDFVGAILEGSQRLEGMVNAFTSFTGVRTGVVQPVQAAMLLRSAQESGGNMARELGREVGWSVMETEASVMVEPTLMTQAMDILLRNSLEAMENGGRISISAEVCGEDCCFEILDDGAGIPEEAGAFIFDPFFSTKADGTGMGLCTAQRIAQELGGSLSVRNRKDARGARAVLSLPIAGN